MIGHPILRSYLRMALYLCFFFFFGLLYVMAVLPFFSHIPFVYVLFDGLFSFLLYALLSIPVWAVIKYADFFGKFFYQRMVAYLAFVMFLMFAWLGILSLVFYLFLPSEFFSLLIGKTFAFKLLIGLLLFVICMYYYKYSVKAQEEICLDDIPEIDEKSTLFTDTSISIQPDCIERVSVKLGKNIHVVNVSDILYLQAEGDYVMIYDNEGGAFLKEQTMKYFEEHLPATSFVRIHRSYILNVAAISRLELYEKGQYLVTLHQGQKLKASLNGYKLLKKALNL